MTDTVLDEGFLLSVLNSTPVVDGVPTDDLADPARARAWLARAGGLGTEAELQCVRQVRQVLQAVARVPDLTDGRVTWTLSGPPERLLAVRAVLAWDALAQHSPGRLRPCAN